MSQARPVPALHSFSCYVADADGSSDGAVKQELVAGEDRLWIGAGGLSFGGDSIVIPYGWDPEVMPLGKGLLVRWKAPNAEQGHAAAFAKRTFFGYDTEARDVAVETFSRLIAERRSLASVVAAAEQATRCHCGEEGVSLDFPVIFGAAFSYSLRSDYKVLCRRHVRGALWARMTRNNLLGFFGVVSTLAGAVRQVQVVNAASRAGCLGKSEIWLARAYALGFWPPLLLVSGVLALAGP